MEQKERLNRVRENITLSNQVLNELKELLIKQGASKSTVEKLIYVAITKTEFEYKQADLARAIDLLEFANDLKNKTL